MDQKQRQIYHTIYLISEGKVASYAQIADLSGLPRRARLVGFYLKLAQTELVLPWHRVLKANGAIAFPKGSDKAIQQAQLLVSENVQVKSLRVSMKKFQWQPDLSDILYKLKF